MAVFLIITGCSGNTKKEKKKLIDKLFKMEKQLYNQAEKEPPGINEARKLVKAQLGYADQYPEDTLSPEFLYKAANITQNILQDKDKALKLFGRLTREYPDHPKAPFAIFVQAFILENQKKISKARKKYHAFIKKYPEHQLRDDAELSLKYLGRDPAEVLDEISKKKKKPADTMAR